MHKAEMFRKYCEEYKTKIENELNGVIDRIVVEEPLYGSNNANTVSLLYGFNGICRYILFRTFNIYPAKISVYLGRKLFCKEYVKQKRIKGEMVDVLSFPTGWKSNEKKKYIWEKVKKLEPQIEWFYKKDGTPQDMNYDMSDSFCTGYAALIQLGILK
jgi:hypothetical protein